MSYMIHDVNVFKGHDGYSERNLEEERALKADVAHSLVVKSHFTEQGAHLLTNILVAVVPTKILHHLIHLENRQKAVREVSWSLKVRFISYKNHEFVPTSAA